MWVVTCNRTMLTLYALLFLGLAMFGLGKLVIFLIEKIKAGRLRRVAAVLKKARVRPEGRQPTQAQD